MRSFFDLQKSSWLLCIPSTKIEGLQYSGRASPRVLGCALKRRPNDTLGSTDLNLCDSTTLRWRIGDVSSVICHYVVMSFRPFTSTCPRWTMMNHDEPWWTMQRDSRSVWLTLQTGKELEFQALAPCASLQPTGAFWVLRSPQSVWGSYHVWPQWWLLWTPSTRVTGIINHSHWSCKPT